MRFVLGLAIVSFSVSAFSSEVLKYICIEERSVGLTWEEGQWVPANFHPAKYYVEKIDAKDPDCSWAMKSSSSLSKKISLEEDGVTEYWHIKSCYNIRKSDAPRYNHATGLCTEHVKKSPSGKMIIELVQCSDYAKTLNFQPDGRFAYGSPVSIHLGDSGAEKDSMVLSVGRCHSDKP